MKRASKSKQPLPTFAETRFLHALWGLREATVEQVVTSFPVSERPNYKTVQAFLRTMEGKGFVQHRISGRVFIFSPLVTEEEIARASVQSLLQQRFGGSACGLLVNLIEGGDLKRSDLREMEDLIRSHRESAIGNSGS